MTIEGVIVDVFGRWCCVNHGSITVDAILDFRRNINEKPIKGAPTKNRTNPVVH